MSARDDAAIDLTIEALREVDAIISQVTDALNRAHTTLARAEDLAIEGDVDMDPVLASTRDAIRDAKVCIAKYEFRNVEGRQISGAPAEMPRVVLH